MIPGAEIDGSFLKDVEGFSESDIKESLGVMGSKGLINFTPSPNLEKCSIGLLPYGFKECTEKEFMETFSQDEKTVISSIYNDQLTDSRQITNATNVAKSIVEYLLKCYEKEGYIEKGNMVGIATIEDITDVGSRYFKEKLN
jgi:hypothetical protein